MNNSPQPYNVLVDFRLEDTHAVLQFLDHHIHAEQIGDKQYQVGIHVMAYSSDRAYHKGVNFVEAEIRAWVCETPGIMEVNVYGPKDENDKGVLYS